MPRRRTNPPQSSTENTSKRVVIDPLTRIEGHLRIEVQIENRAVNNAWSTGTLFRGVEPILQGRNPEDAWLFTQRLCGVCTYVHGSTSVKCVEDAIGVTIPNNARIIRNLLMGAQFLHDHIVHFYHLHALDWVDVKSALAAAPSETSKIAENISGNASDTDFTVVQSRLSTLVESGQLGPFASGYWGHAAYNLEPAENLLLVAHYLEALQLQAKTAKMHAIFGGKNPHIQSLRVGGVTCRDDVNESRIAEFRSLLQETTQFIDDKYLPDLTLLATVYKDWTSYGGTGNFLCYGEFPDSAGERLFPGGVIFDRDIVQDLDTGNINEHVTHSWYEGSALPPSSGQTVPNYTGLNTEDRYSWLKAPRYNGEPMEVGPLARILVAYKSNQPEVVDIVHKFLTDTDLGDLSALYSTLGRTAARALETKIIADAMPSWLKDLDLDGDLSTPFSMSTNAAGVGLNEAPRGALGHWISIQDQKIGNYQMVVPSTWNLGPRCEQNKPGPVESALVGTPVDDPSQPLEVLRTVHSFDPCIACAVHVVDPRNGEAYEVRVV